MALLVTYMFQHCDTAMLASGYAAVNMQPENQGLLATSNMDGYAEAAAIYGSKIEESLSRVGLKYQMLFFVASICVLFAAFVGVLGSIFTFEIAEIVQGLFLT